MKTERKIVELEYKVGDVTIRGKIENGKPEPTVKLFARDAVGLVDRMNMLAQRQAASMGAPSFVSIEIPVENLDELIQTLQDIRAEYNPPARPRGPQDGPYR